MSQVAATESTAQISHESLASIWATRQKSQGGTAATMAAFLLMTGNAPASASDTDSLRLKRDLRACID